MNLSIDERTKHRLTGMLVLLAIAIIFLPAMLKKSNQHLAENIHLSVQIPPKPNAPEVAMASEKVVFETVKVQKLPLPKAIKPTEASQIASLDSEALKPKKVVAKAKPAPAPRPVAKKPVAITQKPKTIAVKSAEQQFAVQIASFSVLKNAESLVSKLQNQGFKARYHVISSADGAIYKVTVGQVDDRADANRLKERLSNQANIKGFIVKHEVS